MLKQRIEAGVPEGAGRLAALLRQFRDAVRQAFPDIGERAAFMRQVLDGPAAKAALDGDMDAARKLMRQAVQEARGR